MKCGYCYATHNSLDMSFNTATQAVLNCAKGDNCGIIFFGGEPLLRQELIWQIIDFCEKSQKSRFHYKLTTNGLLLDNDFLKKAKKHGLHVAISHDGIKNAHDFFRLSSNGKGTFDTLMPKLEMLLEQMPYAPVMLTVTPETVEFFADSVIWLASKGARYLISSLNYAGNWNDAKLKTLKKQYLALSEWHYENYMKKKKIYFSPFDKAIATRIHPEKGNSCRLGLRQISIGPDGVAYPCVQFVGDANYAIGTAQDGINDTRRMQIYQKNEEKKKECGNCALLSRCHNKCGCLNYQLSGDIQKIPPILCEHERILFPIADSIAERLFKKQSRLFLDRHYNAAYPILSLLEDMVNIR